jgi:hypothetical protein
MHISISSETLEIISVTVVVFFGGELLNGYEVEAGRFGPQIHSGEEEEYDYVKR